MTTTTRPFLAKGTGAKIADRFRRQIRFRQHPGEWINDTLGERIWSKQYEIGESVVANRYTAVQSCHDVGKSYIASRLAAWWLGVHPVGEAFVVTTAPTAAQVRTILWREIARAHKKADLPGNITSGQVPEWKVDGEILAYGRKPADYDQAAFQGIHAKYVLVILDEACGIPKSLYEAADSLATNVNARVLAIGNPDNPSSYFKLVCDSLSKEGRGWNTINISAWDWFAEMDNFPELQPYLISPEWVEERKERWGTESPIYKSKVEGQFPEVSDFALITPAMLEQAHILDLPGRERGSYGLDVARYGGDETVCYRNRGGVVRHEWSLQGSSIPDTADRAIATLKPHVGLAPMAVDTIGLGGGVYDLIKKAGHPVIDFNASHAAGDPKKYVNRRAEAYWGLRELIQANLVDLDHADFDLSAQLLSIEWEIASGGRIQIEDKDAIKRKMRKQKRAMSADDSDSPDRADAVMMAVAGVHTPGETVAIPLGNPGSITEDLIDKPM